MKCKNCGHTIEKRFLISKGWKKTDVASVLEKDGLFVDFNELRHNMMPIRKINTLEEVDLMKL